MIKKPNSNDTKIIEARMRRSLRIAFAAALMIALVIPITESIFITSTTGVLVMRSIDFIALVAMAFNLSNAYLLDRRLNKRAEL